VLKYLTRFVSYLVGRLASLPLPFPLRRHLLGGFARLVGADLSECLSPIESFPTLQSFFLREVRKRDFGEGVLSPVDGTVSENGVVSEGSLLQAKGRSYLLGELLGDGGLAAEFEGGSYLTLYLAPRDYHHVHSPVACEVREVIHLPGALLPVSPWCVSFFDRVFPTNERVVLRLGDDLLLVMVGALNVGSIALAREGILPEAGFSEIFRSGENRTWFIRDWKVRAGERLGSFRLGSTVILLSRNPLPALETGRRVRYGEALQ
jgi:phosphatidylserine decarboxylase